MTNPQAYSLKGIYYLACAIDSLPTLHQGQSSDLKIETPTIRIWIERGDGGIMVERFNGTRWQNIQWIKICHDPDQEPR